MHLPAALTAIIKEIFFLNWDVVDDDDDNYDDDDDDDS